MSQPLSKVIVYWKTSAATDLKAAEGLFEKRLYPQCLFFCHLTIEKLLKGLVVQRTKKQAPFRHELAYLATLAALDLQPEQRRVLEDLSLFNIAGRYGDAKMAFYKKYNKRSFAKKYLDIVEMLHLWLTEEYRKK